MKPVDAISGAYNRWAARRCPDPDRTFFDPHQFAWVEGVEQRWRDIRAELDALLLRSNELPAFHEVSERQTPLSDSRWKTFFFRVYGNDIPEARSLCPMTAAVIDGRPNWTTVFFSILDPGMHVAPHSGPFKGVLRYHLGLLVPGDDCAIRVGHDVRHWREGESLVFDDTHEHEVWNDTPSQRVVLFVDFIRPWPGPAGAANRAILSAAKLLHPDVRELRGKASKFCRAMLAATPGAPAA